MRSRRAVVKMSMSLCVRVRRSSILELLGGMWMLELKVLDRDGAILSE